jgi:hypothetical protein
MAQYVINEEQEQILGLLLSIFIPWKKSKACYSMYLISEITFFILVSISNC